MQDLSIASFFGLRPLRDERDRTARFEDGTIDEIQRCEPLFVRRFFELRFSDEFLFQLVAAKLAVFDEHLRSAFNQAIDLFVRIEKSHDEVVHREQRRCADDAAKYGVVVSDNVFDVSENGTWQLLTPEDRSTIELPTNEGTADSCLSSGGVNNHSVSRQINFFNGGINFNNGCCVDYRGDLNLDGIPYTIADAVLYRDYFIYGLSVFENPDSSTVQSDVNKDGIPLTVEDMKYLVMVIIGEALPDSQLEPCDDTARFSQNSGTVTIDFDSPDSLGAVYLKVQGEITPVLEAAGMEMDFHYDKNHTNIIIYSFDIGKSIHGGLLVSGIGNHPLVEAATATYHGANVTAVLDYMLDVDNTTGNLPDDFYLGINYPNPFNPATTFEYNLPYTCEVELTVYNVRGQRVKTLINQTMSAGRHTAEWHGVNDDGQPVASGVYFYRIRTDKFVATKKMVLMK